MWITQKYESPRPTTQPDIESVERMRLTKSSSEEKRKREANQKMRQEVIMTSQDMTANILPKMKRENNEREMMGIQRSIEIKTRD